ncbi:uncharacterized protein TNCV_3823111 [Trichonephila clavipes]|nr:uncharacterized protein TNCV_3823111 [Trichonephila clavipes]
MRNAIETLLMTSQMITDFVNHPGPSTTEPSTSAVRVGTDACKSIINSILRYKDNDSLKNAHKDFQKRFVDNPFDYGCSICDRLSLIDYLGNESRSPEKLLPDVWGRGLYARRPVVCAPLTRQHRTARLQWCREHHNWTEQAWECVLFSDESRFSLSSDLDVN